MDRQQPQRRVQPNLSLRHPPAVTYIPLPISHSILSLTHFIHNVELYSSFSSGHQVSETRADPKYMKIRRAKQEEQLQEREARPENKQGTEGKVFKGTRIYIDGYLDGTTDIEMKKLVKMNGGEIL